MSRGLGSRTRSDFRLKARTTKQYSTANVYKRPTETLVTVNLRGIGKNRTIIINDDEEVNNGINRIFTRV